MESFVTDFMLTFSCCPSSRANGRGRLPSTNGVSSRRTASPAGQAARGRGLSMQTRYGSTSLTKDGVQGHGSKLGYTRFAQLASIDFHWHLLARTVRERKNALSLCQKRFFCLNRVVPTAKPRH